MNNLVGYLIKSYKNRYAFMKIWSFTGELFKIAVSYLYLLRLKKSFYCTIAKTGICSFKLLIGIRSWSTLWSKHDKTKVWCNETEIKTSFMWIITFILTLLGSPPPFFSSISHCTWTLVRYMWWAQKILVSSIVALSDGNLIKNRMVSFWFSIPI